VKAGDQIKFRGEDAVVIEVKDAFIRVRLLKHNVKHRYALLPPPKKGDL